MIVQCKPMCKDRTRSTKGYIHRYLAPRSPVGTPHTKQPRARSESAEGHRSAPTGKSGTWRERTVAPLPYLSKQADGTLPPPFLNLKNSEHLPPSFPPPPCGRRPAAVVRARPGVVERAQADPVQPARARTRRGYTLPETEPGPPPPARPHPPTKERTNQLSRRAERTTGRASR